MNDQEVRMQCLQLAASIWNLSSASALPPANASEKKVVELASEFYEFVMLGRSPAPLKAAA